MGVIHQALAIAGMSIEAIGKEGVVPALLEAASACSAGLEETELDRWPGSRRKGQGGDQASEAAAASGLGDEPMV